MSLPLPAHEAEPELDPGRLRAHQQAGFSRVYQLKPDITTAAVEAPQHIAFVAEPAELKLRVQANLIRLFQIAILVDDFFPSDADEKPSDRLMNIIEVLWDVDVPGIGAPAMRDILKHWYGRHLDWWKANRRSKKVSAGREAVLFALMDQYRRSRRYGLTRREREAESSGNALEASFRSSKGTEVHPRYLASRALQWFQIQFNCADAVHIRVLPCPPPVMDYMSDKGTAFSEILLRNVLRKRRPRDKETVNRMFAADLDWMTIGHGPPFAERYLRRENGEEGDADKEEQPSSPEQDEESDDDEYTPYEEDYEED